MSFLSAGCSETSFMKRLCLGAARWTLSSSIPASTCCSGSWSSFSAAARVELTQFSCARTTRSTSGFSSSNAWSLCSTGPEMMSGVRASSTSTESTSSTMA